MLRLTMYTDAFQNDVERFYQKCFAGLGWDWEPCERHADLMHIGAVYLRGGTFRCLYDGDMLIGTIAVRRMTDTVCEMKRLYVLPDYQGRGHGGLLFNSALDFAKRSGFCLIRLDTRQDRTASRHLIEKHRFRRIEQYNQNEFAELFYELDLIDYNVEESTCL